MYYDNNDNNKRPLVTVPTPVAPARETSMLTNSVQFKYFIVRRNHNN